MSTNKLMEAAADILAGSKANAPAMPPQKLEGEIQDIGGPTPQNYKNDDDSAKLDPTKGSKGDAAGNAASIKAKPSATSGEVKDSLKKEDLDSLFNDETLSEDFKSKASTIFEARVHDKVSQIQEQLEEEYSSLLEEAVESIKEELTEKVDDYLNYVVEQWIGQNEIAIESGLRSEITEDFIVGLRNLFAEHYIDVPSEKVDLVEELASQVEVLESKLDEEIERGVELSKALVESRKVEIVHAICEGLTATQVEKIKSLAESVDFSTEEEYASKLETIRENYFPTGVKKVEIAQLQEEVEDGTEMKRAADPFVNAVSQAISKTRI